jgi:hypothetical protein
VTRPPLNIGKQRAHDSGARPMQAFAGILEQHRPGGWRIRAAAPSLAALVKPNRDRGAQAGSPTLVYCAAIDGPTIPSDAVRSRGVALFALGLAVLAAGEAPSGAIPGQAEHSGWQDAPAAAGGKHGARRILPCAA